MSERTNPLKSPMMIIAAGLVLGIGGVWASLSQGQTSLAEKSGLMYPPTKVRTVANPDVNTTLTLGELDVTFADIAEEASRGVVSIRSRGGRTGGQGSGFIYRADGWIVTNDHVVGNSDTVTVVLNDGREVEGKVIRANDEQVDLAVIKIDLKDLPTLPMANSDGVRPGQFAIAVGSPFGLENTVTIGHVSALGRGSQVMDQQSGEWRGYTGMIQTDAPINPGNSGGPLMNINGEVIGVNSTIYSTNMASAGIGFAIQSNMVKAVVDELIETGKFNRGLIGAMIDDLKPYQKVEMDLEGGALITDAQEGQPAYDAGLRENDVITRIDGTPLYDQQDLRVELMKRSPNEKVELTYVRDGQIRNTSLTLSEPPTPVANNSVPQMNQAPEGFDPFDFFDRGDTRPDADRSGPVRLGVTVQNVNDTALKQFNLSEGTSGVVVTSLIPGSFAAENGLTVGDVIQRINGTQIGNVDALQSVLQKLSWGDRISIDYLRTEGGTTMNGSITTRLR